MDVVRSSDLAELLQPQAGICISIYLPTHRAGPETRQDPLRLKNLLGAGAERLRDLGLRSSEVRALLEPGMRLLGLEHFWRYQSDGLAVFLAPAEFRAFRIPLSFEELVIVGARFHITPLLPYLAFGGRFFLLALSQKELRLFEGSRYSIDTVDADTLPEDLADALKHEDREAQQLLHVAGRGGPGARVIFHGHGVGGEIAKARILRYFRRIDAGLREVLRDEQAPLVLASVRYLSAIYRQANSYPHLMDEAIAGNPEELRPDELHARAVDLLASRFHAEIDADAARFRELEGTGLTATEVEDVLLACAARRVDVLFAAVDEQRWGKFDPESGEVTVRERPRPGDEDLVDRAAFEALSTGARVHALEASAVPDGSALAAIFRF